MDVSGGCEKVAKSTWDPRDDAVVELFSVEEEDMPEDCVLRLGVIVTLLFLLGLCRKMFSGRRVAASFPS